MIGLRSYLQTEWSNETKLAKWISKQDMMIPYCLHSLPTLKKNVLLRWPNKSDEVAPGIRPDAVISTLVQSKFGRHLGYGEVKPGDDSTSTQSFCVDTLKLAVLSRNTCPKNNHPILTFQVNGLHVIFFVTQRIHHRFYTMIEIGRITLPDSLSAIQSFVTCENLRVLLRVTQIFWHCCHAVSTSSPLPEQSASHNIASLFKMVNSSSSKNRSCPIQYN